MKIKDILSRVDHTNLSQTATWDDIQTLCFEAARYDTASVCIGNAYISSAVDYMHSIGSCVGVGACIGFPNGYSTTATKVFETQDAIAKGAEDIDMVINLGWVKDGRYDDVLSEVTAVKEACGNHILKVIIETCFLTQEEKIRMCEIVSMSGADYIKTSTGFASAGATFEDVELFKKHIAPHVKIKAAGGIRTLDDAKHFVELGCERLGTSRIVKACIDLGLDPEDEI